MNIDWPAFEQLAWTQLWQLAVVVLLVTVLARVPCVRRRPHLAYALWLLALAKCLTPPLVASPTSAFSWTLAQRNQAIESAAAGATAAEQTPKILSATAPPNFEPPPIAHDIAALDNAPTIVDDFAAPNAPTPPVATSEPQSTAALLAGLWAIGAIGYAVGMLVRLRQVLRRVTRSNTSNLHDLSAILSELSSAIGLRKTPRFIVTVEPFGPAVVGLFRPALIVPQSICQQLKPAQLRLVVAHELIHLRRGDQWVSLVQFMAQTLWWFNPLVWWTNRELNRIREQCCDEEVVARLCCEPAHYAQTLLDILRLAPRLRAVAFTSGVTARQVTEQRLEHIMSDASRFRRVTPRAYWLTTALAALLLLPGAGLALDTSEEALFSQQDPKQPRQSQTLRLTGSVIERGTKKPIADAKVVVQRIIRKQHLQTDRKSYERRTDARGRYQLDLQGNELEFDEMSFLATLSDPHFVDAESKRAHGNMRTNGERVEVLNIAPIEGLAGDRISGVVKRPD
jgi:beta-lactamase regulating signal transducer with metallopeptidase domain